MCNLEHIDCIDGMNDAAPLSNNLLINGCGHADYTGDAMNIYKVFLAYSSTFMI